MIPPFAWTQSDLHPVRGSRRGFSLIELTVVVAITATVAAIAIPRYAGALARYQLEAATTRVTTDLDRARVTARTTGSPVTVSFDLLAEEYRLVDAVSLVPIDSEAVVALAREPYRAAIVSANFGGEAKVTFDGYGLPNAAGTVVLAVGGGQQTIILNPHSGRASTIGVTEGD